MASRVMGLRRSKAFPVMKTVTFTVDGTVAPDLDLGVQNGSGSTRSNDVRPRKSTFVRST